MVLNPTTGLDRINNYTVSESTLNPIIVLDRYDLHETMCNSLNVSLNHI